ncbi:MAG TPA: universal stress protein [Desulfobacteraceae bacterium]|nr:universal stress protein [Desulfobacteraceae bacterium]
MKLLVAYDAAFADAMLPEAIRLAKAFDAYIYLIRTCPADAGEQDIARLEHTLNEVRREHFKSAGIESEVRILIRGMEPGEDVVQFAKEKEVDQIIIGVQRRSKVGKMMFGSVAQYIILEAECPVLSVK